MNGRFMVAAVQASYVLLDRDATVARVEELVAEAARLGAELVEQAVVVPGPVTARLGTIARAHRVHLVIGVQEREPHGATIYCTVLHFGSDGRLLTKHRKLMPTGSERTVWGQGDGSTLDVVQTSLGR